METTKKQHSRIHKGWGNCLPVLLFIHFFYKIDFGEGRDLSGIKTKGMHGENSWVEEFQVSYSNDGYRWNILKDKNTQEYRKFQGNHDSDSTVTQYFDQLINARYLRITPLRWHTNIGMRLEVIGCYLPYTLIPSEQTQGPILSFEYPQQPVQVDCETCPGLPRAFINNGTCGCPTGLVWDGVKCLPLELCPCFIDHIR